MANLFDEIFQRAVSPRSVAVDRDGKLTTPRSWGVYRLLDTAKATRQFRFGSHPIRMHELQRGFHSCKLEYLFLTKRDAQETAALLNWPLAVNRFDKPAA